MYDVVDWNVDSMRDINKTAEQKYKGKQMNESSLGAAASGRCPNHLENAGCMGKEWKSRVKCFVASFLDLKATGQDK
jgi:hypothetical protein